MNKLTILKRKKRILLAFAFICLLFAALVIKLVFVQGVFSDTYEERQSAMLMQRLPLTASRGDIYDRNMALLAKDSTCASIYVSPKSIEKQEDKAAVALLLSRYLNMEYEDVYRICIKDTVQSLLVKRKVDNSIALAVKEAVEEQGLNGVSIVEDKKRYYTNGRFAPYLLGFTGVEHSGLYGIEASYNKELAGTNGVILYQTDGEGRIVASGSEIKQDAVDGNNLVLSLDSVIQMYAENAVQDAMKRTKAKRVMAIVSDPSNGEILAMAVTPSYDLNNPWDLDPSYEAKFSSSFYKTENRKRVRMNKEEKLSMMWDNPITSFLYEPGSTFKPVTVASALEEGTVSGRTKFYCGGSRNINGTSIHCASHRAHGTQYTGQALQNSCNVAMMEIAMRMGPDAFYKYIYNFGFGQTTGVKLQGEEKGIVPANDNLSMIDYVTKGFGQSISVTPIQMSMSLNSIVNGGYLYEPKLVNQVTSGDGNRVVETKKKNAIRQVISEETSAALRKYFRRTAENYSSISEYNTKSFQMGGKTGTAQKVINGRYSNDLYVCSFYGFAPYDKPKLSCIVIVDEPQAYKSGAYAAAPVSAEILKNSLKYLNSTKSKNSSSIKTAKKSITVPDVRGQNLTDAKALLDSLNIKYKVKNISGKKLKESNATVISQSYYQKKYKKKLVLEVGESSKQTVTVPDLSGMSVQSANEALTKAGLKMKAEGGGICTGQSIAAGKKVKKGTEVKVTFKHVK